MRVIEKEMLKAIKHGRDWAKDNTRVEIEAGPRTYFADVYLHGNHIAEVICRMGSRDRVKPNIETLRNYPTRTTLSRLRVLGVDVRIRKGKVILDGIRLD